MIHQYQLNRYNIVLDVYSGSVHVVDQVAYDAIAGYDRLAGEGELTEGARRRLVDELAKKYEAQKEITERELQEVIGLAVS